DPDVELPPNYIYVGRGIPVRARMRRVRIAERDVDTGNFLILQNVADHVANRDVRSNGKLAYAVAVLIRVTVAPEIVFQLAIRRVRLAQAIAFNPNRERRVAQISVFLAKVI